MEFERDEAKDTANRAKHGVALADAARLDWDSALEFPDERRAYGEERIKAFATLSARVVICIYTIRDTCFRVIFLRKANAREVKVYERYQRR